MIILPCFPRHADPHCLSMSYFHLYSYQIFLYKLVLTDVGFLKAHLSTSLAPSTSAPYLGNRQEFLLGMLRLACLNGKFSHWKSWECINVPWLSDLTNGSTSNPLFALRKMYPGTLALIDINGELALHWLTTCINGSNPMISFHARHQHILSHD